MDIASKSITVTSIIQDYGFPVVAVFFLAYFIWYLWKHIPTQITPKLNSTSATLVKLIDRVRMLDNDLIRLETKVRTFRQKNKK